MKPMRFPRRFPWLIVFLIAVGPVLFSVPLTIWYSFTMPPLERYYYDAYLTVRPSRILRAQRLTFSGYSRPLPAGPKNSPARPILCPVPRQIKSVLQFP
jgi:hypothetical protein